MALFESEFEDLLEGCGWDDVVTRLLGSMWVPGRGWLRLGSEASFKRLDLRAVSRPVTSPSGGVFAAVERFELPDNCPGGGDASSAYRVALRAPGGLCASLLAAAAAASTTSYID